MFVITTYDYDGILVITIVSPALTLTDLSAD